MQELMEEILFQLMSGESLTKSVLKAQRQSITITITQVTTFRTFTQITLSETRLEPSQEPVRQITQLIDPAVMLDSST